MNCSEVILCGLVVSGIMNPGNANYVCGAKLLEDMGARNGGAETQRVKSYRTMAFQFR